MREFQKEKIWDLLLSAICKIGTIIRGYDLIEKKVSRNEIGAPCNNYQIRLKNVELDREIEVSVVDYGVQVMITFYLRKTSSGEELNIRDFLAKTLDEDDVKMFLKPCPCSNFNELRVCIDRLFDRIAGTSDNKLTELLNGEVWIESTFDWHGYK